MSSRLWPFFAYYGGKWRAAPHYPAPKHARIVEPFAGAAGYATRYHDREIVLVERDPIIAEMWRYLIGATPAKIRALPLVDPHTNDGLDVFDLEPGARFLIGFWLNKGAAAPCNRPSKWMRDGVRPNSFWGEAIRERIARQVALISHWTIIEGNYSDAPEGSATWFIDPPYKRAGVHYRESAKFLDFDRLGEWCVSRVGQTIVCENEGADWLPFHPFMTIKGNEGGNGGKRSAEAIWLSPDPLGLM